MRFDRFLLIFFLLTIQVVKSQDQFSFGIFPALTHNEVINDKTELSFLCASKIITFDKQYDEEHFWVRNTELYFQSLIIHHISKKFTFGTGYGFQRNNPLTDSYSNEHRMVQQVVWHSQWQKWKPYLRLRTEERFIRPAVTDDFFGFRLRYLAGIMLPVAGSSYVTFSEEVYFIPTKPRAAFFSENWLYAGMGWRLKTIGIIETGIIYNSIVINGGKDVRNLAMMQLAWTTSRYWRIGKEKRSTIRHIRQF